MTIRLMHGDCLELMAKIPDSSVDMILCDLPYGTTNCRWDSIIPFEPLWGHYKRIIKPKSAIVLTACQPFTTALISSNLKDFKYCWVWNKKFSGNFVQANRMPLRVHEDIVVFCKDRTLPNYYPIKTPRDKPVIVTSDNKSKKPDSAIPIRGTKARREVYDDKFPTSIVDISSRTGNERGLHPTQKPVALMEYLIKTYTNKGDLVLDNCMGSGSTGVACINTGRDFIGIEQDDEYFKIASERIAKLQESTLCL